MRAPPSFFGYQIFTALVSSSSACNSKDVMTLLLHYCLQLRTSMTVENENKKARGRKVKDLLDKIQPNMITLQSDFVGSRALAPTTQLTTAINDTHDVPFARLPRLERLRVQSKTDETELVDDHEDAVEGDSDKNDKPQSRTEKERKIRSKGKSLKSLSSLQKPGYLRKQRKNVITAVITNGEGAEMRGKGKSLKRYLRKQRKNVITAVAILAKLEKPQEGDRKGPDRGAQTIGA
ncbi:hypothetical protein DFH29DRAFT_881102 [Suillus ampliporus]|nr:hypothetical protein DFH29DRAFT_881102 [Suillus ampliporus]